MAQLAINAVGALAGVTPTLVQAVAGDKILCADNIFLLAKNNHATTTRTITVDRTKKCEQGQDHDDVTSIVALATAVLGPFPLSQFDSGDGTAAITYSVPGDFTVAAVRLRQ